MAPPAPRHRSSQARLLLRAALWTLPAATLAATKPAPVFADTLSWRVVPAPTLQSPPRPLTPSAYPLVPAPVPVTAPRPQATAQPSVRPVPGPAPQPTSGPVAFPYQPAPAPAQPAPAPAQPAPARIVVAQAPAPTTPASAGSAGVRDSLRIPPLVKARKPWPAPSLSPGVPSSFVANWGDVFIGASAATAGKQRGGTVDGSWSAGFGIGDAAKLVALELSGGCGSVNNFCANGSFDLRIGRLLISNSSSRLALSAAWQNFAQWGNEGRQDNVFYGGLTYAQPLNPSNRDFPQTLQINAGVGNSRYAPFSANNSESKIGGFASVGVELTPYMGISAGWSGRGANAQLSFTPFRDLPLSVSLLGVDLFDQTPAGTVGVLSVSWGTNFRTASFD
jgi:hypothetical protein